MDNHSSKNLKDKTFKVEQSAEQQIMPENLKNEETAHDQIEQKQIEKKKTTLRKLEDLKDKFKKKFQQIPSKPLE